MKCPNCGADIPEASKFCPQCGNEIKKGTQSNDSDEKNKTAQSQKTTNNGKQKKKIWIIIASIVLIVLVVVLAVTTLTRGHQMEQQKTTSRADTSATISQSRELTETASSRACYIDDLYDIPEEYSAKYYKDLTDRIGPDDDIYEMGFSYADDINHVQPGHTHNSLCFIVETSDGYSLYEYADIKKEEKGDLLPATYLGRTKTFSSEEEVDYYLEDKPSDTYHFELCTGVDFCDIGRIAEQM